MLKTENIFSTEILWLISSNVLWHFSLNKFQYCNTKIILHDKWRKIKFPKYFRKYIHIHLSWVSCGSPKYVINSKKTLVLYNLTVHLQL